MLSAIATSLKNRFQGSAFAIRTGLATLLLGVGSIASAVEVYLLPIAPVGYETNEVPATMKLVRTSTSGTLTVRLSLNSDSVATIGSDYTVAGTGIADPTFPDQDPLDTVDLTTTTVVMPDGESEVLITITPVDDALVEARELMVISIKPINADYVIGAPSAMSLTIADNDHKARIQIPDPIADEDSALFGLVSDPDVQRRAVMRVRFDPFALGDEFTRNLAVQFVTTGGTQPIATLDTDYQVHYKICGNTGATGERSRIGYDKVNIRGTGLGYTLIAHLAGETQISVTGAESTDDALPVGSTLSFSNHGTVYGVTSAGPNGIVLNAPLTANLPNGTGITVLSLGGGGSEDPPTNLTVQRVYPAGSTTINVDFGTGGLFIGDVFQIDDHDGFYVVTVNTASLTTSPTAGASGALTFRRYQGAGTGGGLEADTGGSPTIVTHIEGTIAGGVMQVLVPEESTKVEISATPVSNGDGAEGAEEVRMRMIADEDYEVLTPQESAVFIADRDVSTTISVVSNAGLPSQTGYFRVTFSQPYSRAITVPYLVVDNLPTLAGINNDYDETIPSSVTLVAGQTEALIQVDPIAARGPASVTLTLIANLNYKLSGSTSSGVNPSATMDIANSIGSVSIAATTPTASENATAPVNGLFTVSIVRNAGQTSAIGTTLAVEGTAVVGSRYEFINPLTLGVITPVNNQIQVTVPANQNTVTVGVRPINNFLADGDQIVQLRVVDGTSYLVGTPSTASVTIDDDEPTVSVAFVTDAARPSTPGSFLFSYTGAALSQAVVVNYTYSGTGTLNTDFTAATSVTIPTGNTSQSLLINPIDTPEGTAATVTVTINPSTTYNIGTSTATMDILAADAPLGNKPTPGTINSGASSGGCGLGSGFATLAGLGLFALLAFRRREH